MESEKNIKQSCIEIYKSGNANAYLEASNEGLSIEVGDTCNVIGGKAYVLHDVSGSRLLSAWPDIQSETGYASLPDDISSIQKLLGFPPRTIEEDSFENKQLHLTNYDYSLAQEYGFEVNEEDGVIMSTNSEYRMVESEEYSRLYEIMSKVFHYNGPSESLLHVFNATGGHVGGIYFENKLAGFTTVAYSRDQKFGEALFIDMIGVDPLFQRKGLGLFGLQSCAIVATALGLSKVRLTYDGENTKLAHFYLSSGIQPRDYLYNVYGPGSSRFLAELDLENSLQRQRSIHGKSVSTIPKGISTVTIPPNDFVFQTQSYQLLSGKDRLVIADYNDQHGYIGFYNDTRT